MRYLHILSSACDNRHKFSGCIPLSEQIYTEALAAPLTSPLIYTCCRICCPLPPLSDAFRAGFLTLEMHCWKLFMARGAGSKAPTYRACLRHYVHAMLD